MSSASICSSPTLAPTNSSISTYVENEDLLGFGSTLPHKSIEMPAIEHGSTGGGAIFMDVDEAIHAFGAIFKSVHHAMVGGVRIWNLEANILGNSANSYAAYQIAVEGLGDLLMAGATSTLTIVLGGLAAKCGWEELKEANEKAPELNEKLASLKAQDGEKIQLEEKWIPLQPESLVLAEKDIHTLTAEEKQQLLQLAIAQANAWLQEPLSPPLPAIEQPHPLTAQKEQALCLQQKINATLSEVEMNLLNKGIGEASLVSGAIIAFKAVLESATQAILMISSHNFDIARLIVEGVLTGAQATLATTVGMASTLVLTPVAAFCAVKLGVNFVKKSIALKDLRQAGRKEFNALLKELRSDTTNNKETLVNKYLTWLDNKLEQGEKFDSYFLNWNVSFLASSVIYTVGVMVKATLVIAALAGVTALAANPIAHGVALALIIAGSVVMTVSSHQFLFGHEQQKDYDSYRTEDAPDLDRDFLATVDLKLGTEKGVKLRADLLHYYETRQEAQKTFLSKAPSVKKSFSLPFSAADKSAENSLENWLTDPEGEGDQELIQFMQIALEAQQKYLRQKNAVHDAIHRIGKDSNRANREKDSSLEKRITSLLSALKESNTVESELLGSPKLVEIKKCFIYCQRAQVPDANINWSDAKLLGTKENAEEEQNINQLLAQHLFDESYQTSFDKLVETELQARELCKMEKESKAESAQTKPELLTAPGHLVYPSNILLAA